MPTAINYTELNFDNGTSVVSIVKKLSIPVPKFEQDNGGEPLVYPEGHSKAGSPVVDYEGKPLGEKGIVHLNRGESLAAAPSDGSAIIIINSVKEEDARNIKTKIDELGGDPTKLSISQLKEVLSYAKSLGYEDIYNSDLKYHKGKLAPSNELDTGIEGYSYGRRNDKLEGKEVKALYIAGDITFTGQNKAASGEQRHPNGAIAVFDAGAPEGDQIRTVDTSEVDTYRLADANKIVLEGKNANIARHGNTQALGGTQEVKSRAQEQAQQRA